MRWLTFLASAEVLIAAGGCASCGDQSLPDAGEPDSSIDSDVDEAHPDADQDVEERLDSDPDIEVGADSDEYALPPPFPMELVEVPRDREGLDCGIGCQQITFAEPVFRSRGYELSESHLVYSNDSGDLMLYLVELGTMREYLLDTCIEYWCGVPAVDGTTITYQTAMQDNPLPMTLWRYSIGDTERVPLVTRVMTEVARPVNGLELESEIVAWMDSSLPPDALYSMSLEGGEVTALTPPCLCYGSPHLSGRQVVYQGWPEGYRDVWIVDIDTLERENLTDYEAPQFDPAFDGERIVWADGRHDTSGDPWWIRSNPDIYAMRLDDREEQPICDHPAAQLHPDVHGGLVVWEDFRNADNPNDGRDLEANIDIYLYELETGREVQVTNLPGPEHRPRVLGDRVFFVAEDLIGQPAVFMVDLVEAGLIEPR